jgi:hypothetical protein
VSERLAIALSIAVAVAVAALCIGKASFVAGVTAAFGYVSGADLIALGSLRIELDFAQRVNMRAERRRESGWARTRSVEASKNSCYKIGFHSLARAEWDPLRAGSLR